MLKSLKHYWQRFRRRYWLALAFDIALILALAVAIKAWQSRHLLGGRDLLPSFELQTLAGGSVASTDLRGAKTVLYFFAPWCGVCERSSPNLNALQVPVLAIALDYQSADEVQAFVLRSGLEVPVALGDPELAGRFSIRAFPTYYVIDDRQQIVSRSVGYSTALGLRWRTR